MLGYQKSLFIIIPTFSNQQGIETWNDHFLNQQDINTWKGHLNENKKTKKQKKTKNKKQN